MRTEVKPWSWFGRWLPQLEAQPAWEHCVALIGAFLSFLFRREHGLSLSFSLSLLSLSLPPVWVLWSLSFSFTNSQPLLSFLSLIFMKSLGTFCLLSSLDSLMFSVSFLSLSQTCRWVSGSRTAAAGIPAACLATPSPSTTRSAPRPPLWWRRRSVLDTHRPF